MTKNASIRARAMARGRYDFSAGAPQTMTVEAKGSSARSFSFGDPEPVMSRRELIDYLECWNNGRYYEPPIPMAALTRAENVSPHHASAIAYKVKQLAKDFIPHRLLDRPTFTALAHNYAVTGNGYVEVVPNRIGGIARLKNSLAKYTRRGLVDGQFFYVPNGRDIHAFEPGSVFQLARLGLDQEIYGVPDYLSCLQSAFLNEDATLFRRRYYRNGSHAGFIMYINEEKLSETDADQIEEALARSKGPGNFRNFFLHIPGGKEKGVQLIHPGEAVAKDEFVGIKGTSRDDILAAHRMQPVLIGVVPQNAGGLGDPEKADAVYYRNETVPLQLEFTALNDWLGEEVVQFQPRETPTA